MGKRTNWLVMYDIRDEKRLIKVAKVAENYGTRIQKSLFELNCPASVVDAFLRECRDIIDADDYVLLFSLCEKDMQKKELYGKDRENRNIAPHEKYVIL